MQNQRIGRVIKALRIEHKLTQRQLADQLGVSDKAVSKWERGLGAPDISLIPQLSALLKVNVENLLLGEVSQNSFVTGNMKNSKYYVCPDCQNITVCTGDAEVSCCGKKLAALIPVKATNQEKLQVEVSDNEWYITSQHPMTKEEYISFVAFATGDRIEITKKYPEWSFDLRIKNRGHGLLIWHSTRQGLLYQLL